MVLPIYPFAVMTLAASTAMSVLAIPLPPDDSSNIDARDCQESILRDGLNKRLGQGLPEIVNDPSLNMPKSQMMLPCEGHVVASRPLRQLSQVQPRAKAIERSKVVEQKIASLEATLFYKFHEHELSGRLEQLDPDRKPDHLELLNSYLCLATDMGRVNKRIEDLITLPYYLANYPGEINYTRKYYNEIFHRVLNDIGNLRPDDFRKLGIEVPPRIGLPGVRVAKVAH
ncbi:hypothetical protein C8R42DRAFT_716287 [Lentinula raphanica]|nr:hypothetical protein C8R42DRAFT_716287 [Lentinula raphanica]